ncbi:MAG: helix-turn-helix transcriptional regulator [Verrucomicrobiota bacterium]
MSYLSVALQRRIERRQLSQSDVAKLSGISKSYISRLFSGEFQALSDENFVALLNVFATDAQAQAELIAARCQDVLAGAAGTPGSKLVEIMVKKSNSQSAIRNPQFPEVELSAETERAFAWLRSQCPLNPDLEKHLVGYAKLTGMT